MKVSILSKILGWVQFIIGAIALFYGLQVLIKTLPIWSIVPYYIRETYTDIVFRYGGGGVSYLVSGLGIIRGKTAAPFLVVLTCGWTLVLLALELKRLPYEAMRIGPLMAVCLGYMAWFLIRRKEFE